MRKSLWNITVFLLLLSFICPLTTVEAQEEIKPDVSVIPVELKTTEDYVITGNTVSTPVKETKGEVRVTPSILTDSGWVTVEYYSKQLTGNVDISFGFDDKQDIKPTKVESWESYSHTKTRYVSGIVNNVFPSPLSPFKFLSAKLLDTLPEGEKVAIGDEKLNRNFAYVEYAVPTNDSKKSSKTDIIAYTDYDDKAGTFNYKSNGQVAENYTETYVDWKTSVNNVVSKSVDILSGANDWKSLKVPETVKLNTWHKIRFWVDMPFSGLNKIEGKYNIVIKPTGMSLTDAKTQGKLILLDPWYSYSWNYRKTIVIAHTDDGAQTNYQMKMRVLESGLVSQDLELTEHSASSAVPGNPWAGDAFHVINPAISMPSLSSSRNFGYLTIDLKCDHPELMDATDGQLELSSSGGSDTNELSISTPTFLAATGLSITTSYQTFRIPLSAFADVGGTIDFTNINYIRWYHKTTGADITVYWRNARISCADVSLDNHSSNFSNLNDLRFTTSDGTTLCSYWIEEIVGSSSNRVATVWIKIPSIAAHPDDTTVYMYYGYSSASVYSDLAATFPHSQHFLGSSLPDGWWSSGNVTVANSELIVGSGVAAVADTSTSHTTAKWRIKTKASSNVNQVGLVALQQASDPYPYGLNIFSFIDWGNVFYHDDAKTGRSDIITVIGAYAFGLFDTDYHVVQFARSGANVKVWFDDALTYTGTDANSLAGWLAVSSLAGTTYTTWDWTVIAEYTLNEPIWSSFGGEEGLGIGSSAGGSGAGGGLRGTYTGTQGNDGSDAYNFVVSSALGKSPVGGAKTKDLAGGGGGAGSAGTAATMLMAGIGGEGYSCDITGVVVKYGPGGGGGARNTKFSPGAGGATGGGAGGEDGADGTAGSANTGGGGGGGGYHNESQPPYDEKIHEGKGGAGGSGIVIVKYGSTVVSFTSSTTWTVPGGVTSVKVLVVGGGGGGGESIGGGGGGGGVIYNESYSVTAGNSIIVTVGSGGAGGDGAPGYPPGSKGGSSVFGTLTALGGGGGAGYDVNAQ